MASDPSATYPRFLPVGDMALSVEFGDRIDPAINAAVISLDLGLAASEIAGIIETVPTFRALMICYDPDELPYERLLDHLRELLTRPAQAGAAQGRRWTVPVVYGGAHGDDLEVAAQTLGLTQERVVELHCAVDYLVYLVGFNPGTPNLGGLPKALHIPRRATPRPPVPAGSVAIGGMQTGVTSIPIPTGWYILGRTPVRPYDPDRTEAPFLFRPGDLIRFRPIDIPTFDRLAERAAEHAAVAVAD